MDFSTIFRRKFWFRCIPTHYMIVCSIPLAGPVDGLLGFAGKCSLLSPLMLRLQALDITALPLLFDIIRVSRPVCMLQGISLDMDVLVTQLLDSGLLTALFLSPSEAPEIELLKKVLASFPTNRVGVTVEAPLTLALLAETLAAYGPLCCSFSFRISDSESPETIAALLEELSKQLTVHKFSQFYVYLPSSLKITDVSKICVMHDRLHAIIVPYFTPSIDSIEVIENPTFIEIPGAASARFDLVELFIATLRTDRPDGLFTTVVCDEHDVCLGLVYSSRESIQAAILEEKGIYWSRSRGGLWRKGDTSGMHQELLAVRADCDNDALRFSVLQRGSPPAFCHLNTRTCWGHEHGIYKLQSILQDRLRSAPAGSYTKRLFDDQTFLQKKLLEEAQELMEATEPDHIAAEAADVMYFLMTRCVAGGVTLRDIEHHLDKRTLKVTRRPGNAKEWRTENANKILTGDGK